MGKKILLVAVAAVATVLVSCTDNDLIGDTSLAKGSSDAIEFSAKTRDVGTTRAGYTGNITNTELKSNSFGVFGYYTSGSSGYDYWNTCAANGTKGTNNATNATAANFMYNQKVTWSATANSGYVAGDNTGYWSYTPIKYWPNDFSNADVDDQDDDANTDPAKGSSDQSYSNGRLSFFAYAPYVEFSDAATSGLTGTDAGTYGITLINGANTAAGNGSSTGNKAAQDPKLTYVLNQAHAVDLLWGTAGNTSVNVNNETQDADRTSNSHTGWSLTGSTYGNVSQYPVNINLTKQKTTGVVDFNFKHALSKVGGSTTTQPAGTVTPNGLMVVLDIDDMKGAETGGTKDATTLVTIKSVSIKVGQVGIDENNNETIDEGEKKYVTGGTFNLATGEWTVTASESGSDVTNNITSPAATGLTSSATLADNIAEPSAAPAYNTGDTKWTATIGGASNTELPGVTTNPVNVYKEETNPFVFIPGTYPIMDITVDYIVRTYDANLSTTFSEVEQVITKHVEFAEPVQLNKQYNLLMHLGLTSVKFTATVSDWDVDGTDSNSDGVIEDGEVTIKDVYLPRNVAGYTLSYSSLTEAANSASATATFTATAKCSDTETEQLLRIQQNHLMLLLLQYQLTAVLLR